MFPFVAPVLLAAVALVLWHSERSRPVLLRRAGFAIMLTTSILTGLFVAGEAFDDPGGWVAAGLVAAWVLPLTALWLLAWLRPDAATRLLGALVAVLVAVGISYALDASGWHTVENDHAPIRAVATFVAAASLGMLGLWRTEAAGRLLIVLGFLPVLVSVLGHGHLLSLVLVSAPAVITGALYLASAAVPADHEPERQPALH